MSTKSKLEIGSVTKKTFIKSVVVKPKMLDTMRLVPLIAGSNEMWITYDSSQKTMQIPVLPESVSVSYPDKNDNVYVYGVGDVTIKKCPGAFVLKFDSFFPAERCSGCIDNPKKPKEYVDFMKKVMELDTPCKFIYTGGSIPINSLATIKFDVKEQGGDLDTIYYTLTVTEYKNVSVRKINIKNGKGKVSSKTKRKSTKVKSRKYTVKEGDCLWNIAIKYYRKGSQYIKIYNANKKVIGSNPNLIKQGQVLVIP